MMLAVPPSWLLEILIIYLYIEGTEQSVMTLNVATE